MAGAGTDCFNSISRSIAKTTGVTMRMCRRLLLEAIAHKSQMSETEADRMAEEMKAAWWAENKHRFLPPGTCIECCCCWVILLHLDTHFGRDMISAAVGEVEAEV